MAMRSWSWCAALAAVFGLCAPGTVGLAKPPDLPINLDVECPDAQESPPQGSFTLDLDFLGGKVSLQVQTGTPAAEIAPCLDSYAPLVLDALWRQILAQAKAGADERTLPFPPLEGGARERAPRKAAGRKVQEGKNPADFDQIRISQARAMYLIGERCRKKGDLDKARTCYQEAHLQCPESKYGRQAISRLEEIDTACIPDCGDGTAEEQEPPTSGPQSRESSRHVPRAVAPSRQDNENSRHRDMLRSTVPLGLVPYDLITSEGVWTLYGQPATRAVLIRANKPQ